MKDKFNLLVCQIVVVAICFFVTACASFDSICAESRFNALVAFNGALALNPSSISQFESFSSSMAQSGMGFQVAPPEIAFTELLNNVNYNLYEVYGYDLNDVVEGAWFNLTHPEEWSNLVTQFATGQATVDGTRVDTSVADRIAQRISQGVLTGAVTAQNLLDAGYAYFSTAVPQWGENAKQFFIGKRDSVTGAISDVAPTMVTKMTAQGLAAYDQVYNNLLGTGEIAKIDSTSPIITRSFRTSGVYSPNLGSLSVLSSNLRFLSPAIIYTGTFTDYSVYRLFLIIPSSVGSYDGNYFFISSSYLNGEFVSGNGTLRSIERPILVSPSFFTVNGVEYVVGSLNVNSEFYIGSKYRFGNLESAKQLIGASSSTAVSFDYSSNTLSLSLKNQLDRLLDKYVDSLTLDRINSIVQSIPIGIENDVPVAVPTQAIVDELTDVIDDAIALDEDYSIAFEAAYEAPIDTTADPDPEPLPGTTGTPVPDVFPVPTFDPIVKSFGSMFDVVSIFEPIFLVFGAIGGLFAFWLVVPFVLLFMAIIRILK